MPADQVVHRRPGALVRHMHDVDARHHFQQLAAEMRRCAVAPRRVVELAGLRLRERDELLQRFRRHLRVRHQNHRRGRKQADRHEVLERVVGQRLEARVHGDRGVGHHQRVAVGRCLRDRVHADDAAPARPVLDHQRLAERLADQRLDDAREIIGAAARAERHHQADRARRVGLRERRRHAEDRKQCAKRKPDLSHRHSSTAPFECYHPRSAGNNSSQGAQCNISARATD